MNRRQFVQRAITAGVVRIPAGRLVLAQESDYANSQVLDGALAEMQFWQYVTDNPFDGNILRFVEATLATIGVMRQYGLDNDMDADGGDQAWIAQQEGGWNQYWALMMVGGMGLISDWFEARPEMGNFNSQRTWSPGNVWINGYGPLSAEMGVSGRTELPLWPGTFYWSEGMAADADIDDATAATIGPPPYQEIQWYRVTNPYIPNLVIMPLPTIWPPLSQKDKCKVLNDMSIALATAIATSSKNPNPGAAKGAIIMGIALAAMQVIKNHYC